MLNEQSGCHLLASVVLYRVSQKNRTKFNAPRLDGHESQSHAVFTKISRNYLITPKIAVFEKTQLNILCVEDGK